jgi:hypothetical protein
VAILKNDRKLVATVPVQPPLAGSARRYGFDDFGQTRVAGRMTESVVDALEVVEIDEDQCDLPVHL